MDLNGDGFKDILSGSYSGKNVGAARMAGLFQVFWGTKDGFNKAQTLNGSDGKPLIIGSEADWSDKNLTERICTRPTAVDWDNDGKLDLVTGTFTGSFYLFKGEGAGVFSPRSEQILADGKPLEVKYHSDPMVVDWDGDGDLDVVSGCAGGSVMLAENSGSRAQPSLKPFVELIKHVSREETATAAEQLSGPSDNVRVWVGDINGDGKLDVLVGDSVMLSAPAAGLTAEQMKARERQWQEQYQELIKKHHIENKGASEEAARKLNEQISKMHEARSEFVRETNTGFVWLYLQK